MKGRLRKNRLFWIIGIVGFILDQVTKFAISQTFTEVGETVPLWDGVFHFTYVINTGAAFSLFPGGVVWLRWLSLFVSIGLIAFAWFSPRLNRVEQLGYGFVLAGAVGNGIDRFLLGYVVDFLDFRAINFPVFNLADVCINIGIIFLLIAAFFDSGGQERRG